MIMSKLENIANRRTKGQIESLACARKQFNSFLEFYHNEDSEACPYTNLDEVPVEVFEGNFPFYLRKHTDVMLGTAKIYISAIKTYIGRKNQHNNIHGDWYTDVRNSTERIFYDDCVESGDTVANQTVPMTAEDLKIISEVLFSNGTAAGLESRAISVYSRQMLARISELSISNFAPDPNVCTRRNDKFDNLQIPVVKTRISTK